MASRVLLSFLVFRPPHLQPTMSLPNNTQVVLRHSETISKTRRDFRWVVLSGENFGPCHLPMVKLPVPIFGGNCIQPIVWLGTQLNATAPVNKAFALRLCCCSRFSVLQLLTARRHRVSTRLRLRSPSMVTGRDITWRSSSSRHSSRISSSPRPDIHGQTRCLSPPASARRASVACFSRSIRLCTEECSLKYTLCRISRRHAFNRMPNKISSSKNTHGGGCISRE